MAQLAIRGHATRGREVIELLEMLGGINRDKYSGDLYKMYYFINDNYVDWVTEMYLESDSICFTLEEFLEKFPYKVGDKVLVKGYESPDDILEMIWNGSEIEYRINIEDEWLTADELQPYKEETMENKINEEMENLLEDISYNNKIVFNESLPDETELVLGDNYEIKVEDGKTYVVRKKPQYPKTFVDCCEILYPNENFQTVSQPIKGHNGKKLFNLQKLLICRDAYWKIAGEEMGLGEPWKPDYIEGVVNTYYTIHLFNNKLFCAGTSHRNSILSFPTEEMRDAFYENFKGLIEQCKELL